MKRLRIVGEVIRKSRQPIGPLFFAMNRQRKTVTAMNREAFPSADYVRNAFAWGVMMPDGFSADAWGKCKNEADLAKRAEKSGFTLI